MRGIDRDWPQTPAAQQQLASFAEISRDASPKLRLRAITAIGHYGQHAAAAAAAVIERLEDPDKAVQVAAVESLGRIGPSALNAAPPLIDRLVSTDLTHTIDERDKVSRALDGIDPEWRQRSEAKAALQRLIQDLKSDEAQARMLSLLTLRLFQLSHDRTVTLVMPLLLDPDKEIRERAPFLLRYYDFNWLQKSSSQARSFTPRAIDALQHENREVRVAAIKLLSEIAPLYQQSDTSWQDKTLQIVTGQFRYGQSAAEALTELLADDDPVIRSQAAAALGQFTSYCETFFSALVERLDDDDPQVVTAALSTIGRCGDRAKSAIPRLLKLRENRTYRWQVDDTLRVLEYRKPDTPAK